MATLANFIVLDCETGGLDCKSNPITQFAGILVDSGLKEINRYQTFIKPYKDLEITQKALEVTMTSMTLINKGIALELFVDSLIKFAKSGTIQAGKFKLKPIIVGHNVPFDIGFLMAAFNFCGQDMAEYFASNNGVIEHIDTIKIARMRWPKLKTTEDAKYTLNSCCKRMGIQLTDAHGAMADTNATFKLFKAFQDSFSNGSTPVKGKVTEDGEDDEDEVKTRNFFRF